MVSALPGHRVERLDAPWGSVPSSTHSGLWLDMSLWGSAICFLLQGTVNLVAGMRAPQEGLVCLFTWVQVLARGRGAGLTC